MRHILLLLFSIFIFAGCEKASFNNAGTSSKGDATGFEVVSEDEQALVDELDDEQECVENCDTDGDGDGDGDDGDDHDGDDDNDGDDDCDCDGDGEDDDDDDDGDHDDDDHNDGPCDDGDDQDDDDDGDDNDDQDEDETITPDEVFNEDDVMNSHGCHLKHEDKKAYICKWPAEDETKEITLCVSKNSLTTAVQKRRQDRYFVGICASDLDEENPAQGEDEEDND